jgi:hypothetical protein
MFVIYSIKVHIISVFVTADIQTVQVCIICGDLYPYQIQCVNLDNLLVLTVKPRAKQNVAQPASGFLHCTRVFSKQKLHFSRVYCHTLLWAPRIIALVLLVHTSLCLAMLCLLIFANKENGIMVSSTGTVFLPSFVKFL